MLAIELGTTIDDVKRKIEYMEKIGLIRRISFNISCQTCGSCNAEEGEKKCPGCMPENGFQNMGEMWEVI